MREAIVKSIYYTNNYSLNPIISLEYTDKKSFVEAISSLTNKIEVVAVFAPKGDKCYKIFENLSYIYDDLLLDNVISLYLVNRKDVSIKLYKNEKSEMEVIAILKTDAVLAEYKPSYFSYYYFLPFLLSYPIYRLISD